MPCPAGTYNGSHGLTSAAGCAACPAGTRCPGGSAEALKCAPGTVAPNNSSAACVKCVAGKYQAETGQLTCDDCGKGTYCEAGANAETRCKAGYYSDKVRADNSSPNPNPIPIPNPDPNLTPTLTSTLTQPSTPNQVRADNATACKPCEAGYACLIGSVEMVRCQPGSVTNLTAQVQLENPTTSPTTFPTTSTTAFTNTTTTSSSTPPNTSPTDQATCRKCEAGTFQKNRGKQECEASSRTFTLTLTLALTSTLTPTLTLTLGLRARRLLHQGRVLAEPMRGRPIRQQDRPEDLARLLLL